MALGELKGYSRGRLRLGSGNRVLRNLACFDNLADQLSLGGTKVVPYYSVH